MEAHEQLWDLKIAWASIGWSEDSFPWDVPKRYASF